MVSGAEGPQENDSAPSDALVAARRVREYTAGALLHWVGTSDELKPGRHSLVSAEHDTGAILDLQPRAQQWPLDIRKEALRLAGCERCGMVLFDGAGEAKGIRMGCNSRLCAVCARKRSAKAYARWGPPLELALSEHAELWQLTLTQTASIEPGGLVTARELAHGWRGTLAEDGVNAYPCGGEGLWESYDRFRLNLRAVRQNRSTRDRWREALGGYLCGLEWTGRCPDGTPRYHVHIHILICLPPGREIDWKRIRQDWCKVAGSRMRAQHIRRATLKDLRETLKYPYKVAHLSAAQLIEVLAVARGLKAQQVAGAWHGRHADYRSDTYGRWQQARIEPPSYRRLYVLPDVRDGKLDVPTLYIGSPSTGRARFALATGPKGEQGDEWYMWEDDASKYAALCSVAPGSDDPEPGEDEGDEWEPCEEEAA